MTQYIKKSALLADIESKIKKYTKLCEESGVRCDGYGMYWGGVLSCLNEIWTLCDTLEVKEMDLEKEYEEFAKIVRENFRGISKEVIHKFESKYLELTGKKLYY